MFMAPMKEGTASIISRLNVLWLGCFDVDDFFKCFYPGTYKILSGSKFA